MTIAILPARLANQIAAGEVVERPASVIKELIENSLDAGATAIHITVDKGGVKKIKITDNGVGIAKDELALALSRHATSKITNLSDLEAIHSLGFRGEALASISSVARLTLTSKPKSQDTAWQASAEGRDMAVNITPAAHSEGTTIEVLDLFFNTPARRKFLRTEKTEFNHIDEVVRRIALAHFEVSFTLTHNGKVVRQYRAANTATQSAKRVAMVCGAKFIEHAIEVNCEHDNMKLSGWVAKPSFARNQNDLCYSYVNGRMMRDKLINHAIRQAYDSLLPSDTYPAFVLFLQLDYREVDVNVHPAKHEVRFHQSRYVHDFIYSICNKALISINESAALFTEQSDALNTNPSVNQLMPEQSYQTENPYSCDIKQGSAPVAENSSVSYSRPDYVAPLQHIREESVSRENSLSNHASLASSLSSNRNPYQPKNLSTTAIKNYSHLIDPVIEENDIFTLNTGQDSNQVNLQEQLNNDNNAPPHHLKVPPNQNTQVGSSLFIHYDAPGFALFSHKGELRLLSLFSFAQHLHSQMVEERWLQADNNETKSEGLVSQPLLLPVIVSLSQEQMHYLVNGQSMLTNAGIVFVIKDKQKVQVRQFPAVLRDKDVAASLLIILDSLKKFHHISEHNNLDESAYYQAIAKAMLLTEYTQEQAEALIQEASILYGQKLTSLLLLNSVVVDLTSYIEKLI